MELNLRNPIVFFDIESTGINVANDRIIEISFLKILVSGEEESLTLRINPEMPIPQKSIEIHGIKDEDIKDKPTFKQVAKQIISFMEGCDIAGYNSNKFDIPMLAEEFIRAGVDFDMKKRKFVDVQVLFLKMEQRTLEAAYRFYCNKELKNAHSAEADVRATYEVLKAQIDRYENIENDVEFLNEFTAHNKNVDFAGRIIYDENRDEVFNFGKYKGKKVSDVLSNDPGYYGWFMNADFPRYTKKILTEIKLRTFTK